MSKTVNGFITWIRSFLDDVYAPKGQGGGITFDDVYPVGAIYMSVNSTSPSTLFGGTWQRLEDTFLYATSGTADTGYQATSGEATHTLTVEEMPSHNHTQNQHHHKQSGKYSAGTSGSSNGYTYDSKRTITDAYTDYQAPYINPTGGGEAHNNMPPYMKVYMWKRTE